MKEEKVSVTIADVKAVESSIEDYKTNMELNAGILNSMIENADDWNDNQSKKFEEIIKNCVTQLKGVANECEAKNKELQKVEKIIEKYNNVFDAFN